ncbi:MAG: hypothetical protein IT366_24600 [Candidatus Hydrogenedentes bacterium]|nr:hypothetical protein [Candidatus Hydrogenedentota bacterium]
MAYRFKARSTTPGEYRFATTVLQNLIALSDIRSGTGRGDGGIGTCAVPAATDVRTGVAVDNTTGSYGGGGSVDYPDAMTFGD